MPDPQALPFLTFQPPRTASATEAMDAWTSLFADGEVRFVQHRDPDDAGGPRVAMAEFVVAGQRLRCSDSPPVHAWTFSPAVALFVECGSTEEQVRLYTALAEGGQEFMPLDDYGFGPFGWVEDRFGVSWQLAAPAG